MELTDAVQSLLEAAEHVSMKLPDGGLGFKYVRNPEPYIDKQMKIFQILDPKKNAKIFEIGPGVGYFAFFCCAVGGCDYTGIDSWLTPKGSDWVDDSPYTVMHDHLALTGKIKKQMIKPFQAVDFDGTHDFIVAIQIAFSGQLNEEEEVISWGPDAHIEFLTQCRNHLSPDGGVFLQFNRPLVADQAIVNLYQSLNDELFFSGKPKELLQGWSFNRKNCFFIPRSKLDAFIKSD